MRVLIISDLHIEPTSSCLTSTWVNNFCDFISSTYTEDTLLFILGDIISNDGKHWNAAFDAADNIFSHIETTIYESAANYKIAFVPGNHDYCDKSLERFDQFCSKHQTAYSVCPRFSESTTFNFVVENFNFIMTDSIQDKNYAYPGKLDIESIRSHIHPDKENILFMHHSLFFEDSENHTGVVNQPQTVEFLREIGIKFVFHGHAHAAREFGKHNDCTMLFGVGSIGVENPGITNEQEQFLEISINGNKLEAVANWLWRGGEKQYENFLVYPKLTTKYSANNLIPYIRYIEPENYIKRYVLPREIANKDHFIELLSLENKKTTLFDVCLKEKLVLFIADAGLGKTVEMQHLAYTITNQKKYLRPIYLELRSYSGTSIEKYIYTEAPKYKTLNPNQLVLIMDGFDELSHPEDFKRELFKYIQLNSNVHICISMRSNFLSSNSTVFDRFHVCQLLEFSSTDINIQLQKFKIDSQCFWEEANLKNLSRLLPNPFYLEYIIEIFLSDAVLPIQSQLLSRFVQIRFSKDVQKFEFTKPLDDSHYEFERALTRFAYGLQLLNYSSCDENTYERILSKEDRQYIKYSSLTINSFSGHSFSHNIFKEYFVAKYLSELPFEDLISQIEISGIGTNYLNPNWFNIAGLVLQLESSEEFEKFKNWILKSEPLLLTKLEVDRVNDQLRYALLRNTLLDIIDRNIWFHNEICSVEQLAHFVQSEEAVHLLIGQIKEPAHFRSLHFCLSLLANFSELYGLDDEVRQVLVSCYKASFIRSYEKRVAIFALASLGLQTTDISEDLVKTFSDSNSSYERLGVYEYLKESDLCNKYVHFLLSGIKYLVYSFQDESTTNGTEHYTLVKCLHCINENQAINEVIRWYSISDNLALDYYNRDELLSYFFSAAASAYNNGYTEIFDTVYSFFSNNVVAHYERPHVIDVVLAFFLNTDTLLHIFTEIASTDSINQILIIEDAIECQPKLLDVFCSLYAEDKLSDASIFNRYTLRHSNNNEIFFKCSNAIKKKTGEDIKQIKPIDYDLLRRMDNQAFFDCLFNFNAMQDLLTKLLTFYGNQNLTVSQLHCSLHSYDSYPKGTHTLELTIIQSGYGKDKYVANFLESINWDSFVLNRICYLLKNRDKVATIIINSQQKEQLHKIFDELGTSCNFHTAVSEPDTKTTQISTGVYEYLILREALNFSCPPEFYLNLLEIPYFFISEDATVESKYNLIETHTKPHLIKSTIEALLKQEQRTCILSDLMFGCIRYKIRSCMDIAISMCRNSDISAYERKNALQYLFRTFNHNVILQHIMPTSDTDLFEMIVQTFSEEESLDESLKCEMINRYHLHHSHFLLKELIKSNVSDGLQFYIEESKRENRIMDYSDHGDVTEVISCVHDINLLPLLVDATRMRFSNNFQDGSFHTLYGALLKAFIACSKSNYILVLNTIDTLKESLSDEKEAVGFCNALHDEILKNLKNSRGKKWTPAEVRQKLIAIV